MLRAQNVQRTVYRVLVPTRAPAFLAFRSLAVNLICLALSAPRAHMQHQVLHRVVHAQQTLMPIYPVPHLAQHVPQTAQRHRDRPLAVVPTATTLHPRLPLQAALLVK